ncbi:MAG: hypothetical protein WCP22_07905 [Chlamydiota bacterium]
MTDAKVIDFDDVLQKLGPEQKARHEQAKRREIEKKMRQPATIGHIVNIGRRLDQERGYVDALLVQVALLRIRDRRGWFKNIVMKPPDLAALRKEIDVVLAERDMLVKNNEGSAPQKKPMPRAMNTLNGTT